MRITSSTAERSPFPSRGRTKARSKLGRGLQLRAFEAIAVLINSAVIVLSKAAREALTRCSTAGGCSPALKPAGRSPSPPGMRVPDTLWGGLEGFRGERNPSTQFPARTAASDGQTAITRACAKRRAQVCGEVTVGDDGQGNP